MSDRPNNQHKTKSSSEITGSSEIIPQSVQKVSDPSTETTMENRPDPNAPRIITIQPELVGYRSITYHHPIFRFPRNELGLSNNVRLPFAYDGPIPVELGPPILFPRSHGNYNIPQPPIEDKNAEKTKDVKQPVSAEKTDENTSKPCESSTLNNNSTSIRKDHSSAQFTDFSEEKPPELVKTYANATKPKKHVAERNTSSVGKNISKSIKIDKTVNQSVVDNTELDLPLDKILISGSENQSVIDLPGCGVVSRTDYEKNKKMYQQKVVENQRNVLLQIGKNEDKSSDFQLVSKKKAFDESKATEKTKLAASMAIQQSLSISNYSNRAIKKDEPKAQDSSNDIESTSFGNKKQISKKELKRAKKAKKVEKAQKDADDEAAISAARIKTINEFIEQFFVWQRDCGEDFEAAKYEGEVPKKRKMTHELVLRAQNFWKQRIEVLSRTNHPSSLLVIFLYGQLQSREEEMLVLPAIDMIEAGVLKHPKLHPEESEFYFRIMQEYP